MEPFKNWFNEALVRRMAGHFLRLDRRFAAKDFIARSLKGFEALELKQRSNQIAAALEEFLPESFAKACRLLEESLAREGDPESGIDGWAVMPMAEWVARKGLGDFERSLALLKEMTKRLTAELAIRPFLIADAPRVLKTLEGWVRDENHHVRRLVSEGTRPRLPWAMQLPAFIADPKPLLPLLEALRDDGSDYVRRSVANNLNDIGKDHPELIAGLAANWLKGATDERAQLVRHACRDLVKRAHPGTLKALGFKPAELEIKKLTLAQRRVHLGGALEFSFTLRSREKKAAKVALDYAIFFMKANGKQAPKVFKGWNVTLAPGESRDFSRRHAIVPITTRVYYPGTQRLEIRANGKALASGEFHLETKAAGQKRPAGNRKKS